MRIKWSWRQKHKSLHSFCIKILHLDDNWYMGQLLFLGVKDYFNCSYILFCVRLSILVFQHEPNNTFSSILLFRKLYSRSRDQQISQHNCFVHRTVITRHSKLLFVAHLVTSWSINSGHSSMAALESSSSTADLVSSSTNAIREKLSSVKPVI